MGTRQLEELSGVDILDEFDVLHRIQHETEIWLLQAAVEFAHQHGEGTVDADRARLPGRQRAVRLGGVGTPKVAEFAPALVAGRLQLSPYAGGRLVADALDLCHRLPLLWARLERFEARAGHARLVARKTRELSMEQTAEVDARVAEAADGRLPWFRFEALVDAAIVDSDPIAAAEREAAAAAEQFAKATRSADNGMRGFYVRSSFDVIARIDATVAYVAQALLGLGDTDPLDLRRVKAVLILANPTQAVALLRAYAAARATTSEEPAAPAAAPPEPPTPERFVPSSIPPADSAERFKLDESKLLPAVILYVHLTRSAMESGRGVARVEGMPPITAGWVRERLGPRAGFTITPVFDPLAQTPVDAWEIPRRHRQAVHLMTPADTFPFASNTTRSKQIDHTRPYRKGARRGQSRVGNYGPMTTFHHRIKTHGEWQVRQPFPGIYLWRDGHGATYLVDHTGTRRLHSAA